MASTPSDLVPDTEAAPIIRMSVAFLRSARVRGTIGKRTPGPPFYKLGRSVRYSRADLAAWLAEQRRPGLPIAKSGKPAKSSAAGRGAST